MFRRLLFVTVLTLATPLAALAQGSATTPATSVGAYVGAELDNPDNWILFGGQALIPLQGKPFEVNPRFTYHPFDGGKIIQLDVNIVHDYELAKPSTFLPYVGIGGAFNHFSFDGGGADSSESKVGLNLLSGARFAVQDNARFQPYFNAQYTIIRGEGNSFTIVVGANFKLH